jgi:acetyltransferase-like isoleucine patch superfamily enzyme
MADSHTDNTLALIDTRAATLRPEPALRPAARPGRLVSAIRGIYRRIRSIYDLHSYTPDTIAAYFRRQGAQIGDGCFIVPTYLGTEPYLIKIGNHVAIAAGVAFITHDGAAWVFRDRIPDLQVFGPIVIEDNCFIGMNAVLCPNIRIGRNSVVAAGSVVISDVPPNSVVMGVPARPWGSLEKYREKCAERWVQQRPAGAIVEPGATWWNSRHAPENFGALRRNLLHLFRDQLT